jgi:hypothetical protein
MASCRRRKIQFKFRRPRRRRDLLSRMLVDIGIAYAPSLGKTNAAEFLRGSAIPPSVIQRVLSTAPDF